MDEQTAVEAHAAALKAALYSIFYGEDHLPLVREMYRTYLYSSLFPWRNESRNTMGTALQDAPARTITSLCTYMGSRPRHTINAMPSDRRLPHTPNFEEWLAVIRTILPRVVEDGHTITFSMRELSNVNHPRLVIVPIHAEDYAIPRERDPIDLVSFIVGGMQDYINLWQNADNPDPW